jgi:type VI secretion system protein VasD
MAAMQPPALVTLLCGALVACSSAPPPAAKEPTACALPTPALSIIATERANASSGGQGRPVQVRIYQLKSDAKLVTAKFEDIWQTDATVLEGDIVKVEEHTVYPGQTQVVKITRNPEARILAAVALFREPQGKNWYLTYELASAKKEPPCPAPESRISVWLDRMQIEDGQGRAAEGTASSPPSEVTGTKGN